jgi:hypothetical protein
MNLVEPPTKTRWGRREAGSNMQENISITPPPSTRMFKTCSDFVTQYIVMNSNKYLYKFRTCATSTNSIQHAINYRHAFTDQLVSVHCKMQCIVFYHKNTLMLTFKRSILMLNVFNLAYCQASNDLFDYIYYLLSLLF